MHDVDALIRSLRGPSPPTRPPVPTASRAWVPAALAAAVAIAAGVTLFAATSAEEGPTARGAGGAVDVDLRLVVDRGGVATRASAATTYAVGERVYFRIAASREAVVHLWVDSPNGIEPIASVEATPQPADVHDEAGLIAYGFDGPGRFTFYASTEGAQICHGCAAVTLEVR